MTRTGWKGVARVLVAVTLLVAVGSSTACFSDTRWITAEEASALVRDYLQIRVDNTEDASVRWDRQGTLNEAGPDFHASFVSDGQWRVQALGWDETYTYLGGEWIVYERSRTVEPANGPARGLLQQWQGPLPQGQ